LIIIEGYINYDSLLLMNIDEIHSDDNKMIYVNGFVGRRRFRLRRVSQTFETH